MEKKHINPPELLVHPPMEPTFQSLAAHALMRQQELDGFAERLLNGADDIALPVRASRALDVLAKGRAIDHHR